MSHKRIVWAFMIIAMLVIPITVTQAQAPLETGRQEMKSLSGGFFDAIERQKTAIVGAWLATSGDGSKALLTFNADGTLQGTLQGAVNPNSPLGVISDGQGAWQHLGGRQFGKVLVALLYDINTGQLNGFVKVRSVMILSEDGNQITATDKLEVLGPDGQVIFPLPTSTGTFTRIKYESFN